MEPGKGHRLLFITGNYLIPTGNGSKAASWENLGVKVQISSSNLEDEKSALTFMQSSLQLGPVEGLYVVRDKRSDDVSDTKFAGVLSNLDVAARKLCPELKHFVVITEDSDIGTEVVLQRVASNLPATAVELPKLRQVQDTVKSTERVLSWRGGVQCVERAVSGGRGVLRAAAHVQRASLLQQIADKADISISYDVSGTETLQDLGMEASKAAGVAAFLRDVHNIALDDEEIPLLTVEKTKEMSLNLDGSDFTPVQGLGAFFSFMDPDEMLATTEMVFLPTLTNSATMRDDEFDVSLTYLCVVPGMEGLHARFRLLCERLKLPALVLQPGLDLLHETLPQLARRYAQILLQKIGLKSSFRLLGYESGVIVALEMAAILEQHGLTGTVYCVGAAPNELKSIVQEQIANLDEAALREQILRHMYTLIGGTNTAEIEQVLAKATTWKEKLDACVRTLLGHVAHSAQYAKALIEAAYARIMQTVNYEVQPKKLKSKIIFLHAKRDSDTNELQAYSEQPIVVHDLEAPLAHSAMDLRCSVIVNRYLDKNILEEFEKTSLCQTYLINADTFMMNSSDTE